MLYDTDGVVGVDPGVECYIGALGSLLQRDEWAVDSHERKINIRVLLLPGSVVDELMLTYEQWYRR